MAQVKGTAVQASMRYARERFGEAPLARVVDALSDADRTALGQGVLASSWYPMEAFLHFMQEAQRQLGAQEADVVGRMGRASCDYGLTTVYKIFFKVGSPGFIISRAARVFASYYDTGDLKVVESEAGRAVIELTALEGGAPQFCERIYGWMQRTLERAGTKGLRLAHTACVHRGDAACRFEGSRD
jgi:hypothetical protein